MEPLVRHTDAGLISNDGAIPSSVPKKPFTPPPSPHRQSSSYAISESHQSSPSHSLVSQWDAQTATSLTSIDCAPTPKPVGDLQLVEGQFASRVPHERFLLLGSVPRDTTSDSLKDVFRPFGDLLGIYTRFLQRNGIVILAFHDSRQCLAAHDHIHLHQNQIFPSHDRSLSSQLLTPSSLRALIGDSEFIADAEASVVVHAEAFVNSALLRGLLESYGPLCSFQPVDHNSMVYACEFYDARHARSAIQALDCNVQSLSVPLKVMLKPAQASNTPMASPALPLLSHLTLLPGINSPSYGFPPTPTTPQNPHFGVDHPDIPPPSTLPSYPRDRHDTLCHPPTKPAVASNIGETLSTSRSRRCSTGTNFVPGETTPLGVQRFRASLLDPATSSAPPKEPRDARKRKVSFDRMPSSTGVLGLALRVKETSAGLLLLDGPHLPQEDKHVVEEQHHYQEQRRPDEPMQVAEPPSSAGPHHSMKSFALPPFMGPLPLPSPLPPPTMWSPALPRHPIETTPFPFQVRDPNDPMMTGGIVYSSSGRPPPPNHFQQHQHQQPGPPPHRSHPLPPRLRQTSLNIVPPSLRSPHLPLSARSPSSPLSRDPPLLTARNTIDLDRLANGLDTRTTIMIKNVPSRMTHRDMETFVKGVCEREFDFLYLRMDFVTGNNVGYAFINFIEVASLLKFLRAYLGKRWNMYSSDKVMYAAYATYQGKAALVTKFQNSSILDREEAVQPHIYYSAGEDKGLPEPFPAPNDSARKARSLAAASEYGLYSRMDLQRRQQMSQHQHQQQEPEQHAHQHQHQHQHHPQQHHHQPHPPPQQHQPQPHSPQHYHHQYHQHQQLPPLPAPPLPSHYFATAPYLPQPYESTPDQFVDTRRQPKSERGRGGSRRGRGTSLAAFGRDRG